MTEDTDTDPAPLVPDVVGVAYPDTSVGMFMQQRDAARASASAARGEADRFADLAASHEARAARLQEAIDALGGDEPVEVITTPNDTAPDVVTTTDTNGE